MKVVFRLKTLLVIIFVAKLCGQDTPVEIADWAKNPAAELVRLLKLKLNDYLDWPGLGQVYRLERRFTWVRQGKAIKAGREVEYGITSLSREKASPKRVLQVRRKHWLIETGLGWRASTRNSGSISGHSKSRLPASLTV